MNFSDSDVWIKKWYFLIAVVHNWTTEANPLQLCHLILGGTYKTAWHKHRFRKLKCSHCFLKQSKRHGSNANCIPSHWQWALYCIFNTRAVFAFLSYGSQATAIDWMTINQVHNNKSVTKLSVPHSYCISSWSYRVRMAMFLQSNVMLPDLLFQSMPYWSWWMSWYLVYQNLSKYIFFFLCFGMFRCGTVLIVTC